VDAHCEPSLARWRADAKLKRRRQRASQRPRGRALGPRRAHSSATGTSCRRAAHAGELPAAAPVRAPCPAHAQTPGRRSRGRPKPQRRQFSSFISVGHRSSPQQENRSSTEQQSAPLMSKSQPGARNSGLSLNLADTVAGGGCRDPPEACPGRRLLRPARTPCNDQPARRLQTWRASASGGLTQEELGERLGGWSGRASPLQKRSGRQADRKFDADEIVNIAVSFGRAIVALSCHPRMTE